MCRTQCLLALVALYVGLAHSWDIAVGVGDELIFYSNGTVIKTVNLISRNLTALAYDEVNNMMLYVDKQRNNDAICGYDISSTESKCFVERNGRNIHSIAFDPATQTLFFTDTNDNSINWISLKPGTVNNVTANLLIKMDGWTPSDIAVDSCKGYIYWTITYNNKNYDDGEGMERARLNGSGREIIYFRDSTLEYSVWNLVVDPLTRKIYYFAGSKSGYPYKHEYLNRADLNEKDKRRMYGHTYTYDNEVSTAAIQLTVSKYYLYWLTSTRSHSTIWQLPKNAMYSTQPEKIKTFFTEKPLTIATNYKIKDQIQGLQDCEALSSLIQTITVTNRSLNIDQTTETEPTTDYTIDVDGHIGERCEVSVCQNYCLNGNCSLNDEGLPTCSCNAGYTGERCEADVCFGYCLNYGTCSLNENSEPVCECKEDYVGDRCEVSDCLNYCIQGNCSVNDDGLPTCRCNAGYSGKRCEVYGCHGYCLNDGDCSLNEVHEPVCQCAGNHEGSRCAAVKDVTNNTNNTLTYYSAKRNLTLADLLANWRKPSARVTVTVEV